MTTQGAWSGHYGSDGYDIAHTTPNAPAYVTVTAPTGGTWAANTADPRALQNPATLTTGAATFWYGSSSFTLNADVTDGNTHELSLYAVDWDSTTRAETITLTDQATGTVLDTRSISAFHDGEYLSWNVSGDVNITVARTGGANAVVSGLFFDPAGTVAPPTDVQTLASPGQVDLTWTAAPSKGAYNVYRTDSSGNTTEVATGITGTSYSDTSPTDGTAYTYAITSVSGGSEGPPSASSAQATPGGIWVPVLDASGNPVSVTPDISSSAVSDFNAGSALPAGTYRVDYTEGVMTYDISNQGYRVNAWNNSNNKDGFEVEQNNTPTSTDLHAPGSDTQVTNPTAAPGPETGPAFTFAPTGSDTLGVYLHDSPYGDNRANTNLAKPTFTLEEVARIKSVGFGGASAQMVNRDDGSGTYDESTDWLDGNLNGSIDGTPNLGLTVDATNPDGTEEHDYPVSGERSIPGTPDVMQATLTIAAALPVGTEVKGATSYNGMDFAPVTVVAADVTAGVTTLTLTADTPLPSTIDETHLKITWEYSTNGGQSFGDMEETSNILYVTGASAPGAYETELYIGCGRAGGLSPHNPGQADAAADQAVAEAIWQSFSTLNVLRVDGVTMAYDHSGATTLDAAGMLGQANGLGQCTAWADLLVKVLNQQGVAANTVDIQSVPGVVGMNPGSAFTVKLMPAQGSNGNDYTVGTGPAPGNAFGFHEVVYVPAFSDEIFDPSYGYETPANAGSGEFAGEVGWQDHSLVQFLDGNGNWQNSDDLPDLIWQNNPNLANPS